MSFSDFIGTWKLISFETHRGEEIMYPFGEDAVGYIIYNPEGFMSAFLAPRERVLVESGDIGGASVEEKVSAADTFIGYCGRFEVFSDKVIHRVEVSFFPNWVGGVQERFYKFNDNRLTLSTAPMLYKGEMHSGHLIWEKVKT
jgi:hypothetical protein